MMQAKWGLQVPDEPADEKDHAAVSEAVKQVFGAGPVSAASGEQSMLQAKCGLQVPDVGQHSLSGKAAGRSTMHAQALERRRHASSGKGRDTAPAKRCG